MLGEVRYERPIADSVLSDDERVEGICLSCRAVPITNIVIELQEGDRFRKVLGFAYPSAAPLTRPASTRLQATTEERQKGMNDMSVMRLGYVHLRVTDLEEARDHYSNTLGMEVVHEEPGKLYLKCWDEWDHHSLVLEEGGVGLVKLGYKCRPRTTWPSSRSAPSSSARRPDGSARGENLTVGDGVRITLPSEHTLELYTDMEFTAPRPGRSTPRRGRGTCGGSARTGSTTR